MAEFDLLIKNGTVVDGLRSGRFRADIGIRDGKIASIGRHSPSEARKVLDAGGLIVAPGFIDLHTHYDSQIFWDPWCSISSWHGVTSVAIGNCGFGFAPCRPEDQDRAMLSMSRNEAVPLATMRAGMPWDWESFPEFLDSIERTPKAVNLLSYVPLSPVMAYAMGGVEQAKSRAATPEERQRMFQLLKEAMDAGACGWSAQMAGKNSVQRDYDGSPMITDLMRYEDALAFGEVLKHVGRGIIQTAGAPEKDEVEADPSKPTPPNSERSKQVQQFTEELSVISGGCPILYNAVAIRTDQHGVAMDPFRDTVRWLEEANLRGARIYGQGITVEQAFEFTLENWNLFDQSPLWRDVLIGSKEEHIRKMTDPDIRAALRKEAGEFPQLFIGVTGAKGLAGLTVHFVENEDLRSKYEGYTIEEIAEREGKHAVDAVLDIAVADNLETVFGSPPKPHDYDALREMLQSPYVLPGLSDGGAHTKFMTMGTYPTDFLLDARDHDILSLEEAHWRLSTLPALAAGFRDRGYIREGMPADLVVYDFENLALQEPRKAWDYPANEWRLVREAEGYRWILVNGEVVLEDGATTEATPGKLLRHGAA